MKPIPLPSFPNPFYNLVFYSHPFRPPNHAESNSLNIAPDQTSIMAVAFEGGVVIGADSRTTTGSYIVSWFFSMHPWDSFRSSDFFSFLLLVLLPAMCDLSTLHFRRFRTDTLPCVLHYPSLSFLVLFNTHLPKLLHCFLFSLSRAPHPPGQPCDRQAHPPTRPSLLLSFWIRR